MFSLGRNVKLLFLWHVSTVPLLLVTIQLLPSHVHRTLWCCVVSFGNRWQEDSKARMLSVLARLLSFKSRKNRNDPSLGLYIYIYTHTHIHIHILWRKWVLQINSFLFLKSVSTSDNVYFSFFDFRTGVNIRGNRKHTAINIYSCGSQA